MLVYSNKELGAFSGDEIKMVEVVIYIVILFYINVIRRIELFLYVLGGGRSYFSADKGKLKKRSKKSLQTCETFNKI